MIVLCKWVFMLMCLYKYVLPEFPFVICICFISKRIPSNVSSPSLKTVTATKVSALLSFLFLLLLLLRRNPPNVGFLEPRWQQSLSRTSTKTVKPVFMFSSSRMGSSGKLDSRKNSVIGELEGIEASQLKDGLTLYTSDS